MGGGGRLQLLTMTVIINVILVQIPPLPDLLQSHMIGQLTALTVAESVELSSEAGVKTVSWSLAGKNMVQR